MKKYTSQSDNVLAITFTHPVKKELVSVNLSKGDTIELPEDHEQVAHLVFRGHLVEYQEPKKDAPKTTDTK